MANMNIMHKQANTPNVDPIIMKIDRSSAGGIIAIVGFLYFL